MDKIPPHNSYSNWLTDSFKKCTAHDFMWLLTIHYILNCHYKNKLVSPKDAMQNDWVKYGFMSKQELLISIVFSSNEILYF